MRSGDGNLDPRAWLAWAVAASLPPTLGRNPIALGATLIVVIAVREAWKPWAREVASWSIIVRMAMIFALVGIVFNILTYHGGDRAIVELPGWLPIVGGSLTLNALLYGTLSGLALLTLVLIGTTVGALINWSTLLRELPNRLMPVAVAGTVAFAFVPQTAQAFRQIREAQLARGHRLRGARDLVPLLVPMLTLGLERAITLAEAMESRGFGAPQHAGAATVVWRRLGLAVAIAATASAGYLLAVGKPGQSVPVLATGIALFVVCLRGGDSRRTVFRAAALTLKDWLVLATSCLSAVVLLAAVSADPASILYEPYPSITIPRVNLFVLLAIALLLLPGLLIPTVRSAGDE